MGGLRDSNKDSYELATRRVSNHFDQHKFRIVSANHDSMDHIDPSQPRKRFPYGSIGYVISSNAARILVELVKNKTFVVPAGFVVMKLMDLVDGCYTARPQLIGFEQNSVVMLQRSTKEDSNNIPKIGYDYY